ncbi:expressed unknown protein [Seminavis robusta]|uniref:Uncharacterized protein n=1 Tax=Seminavis robusta TaxID=568900 RepID=A0A9N8HAZ3_9STRA|nr:expressed unknown protein [Seminavis robusta]|eukprot:Sro340_g121280.1 n/a (187) ;mRNA; r:61426-61986
MAKWQSGTGYKMLIVADAATTYRMVHMNDEGFYPHIDMAEAQDVERATGLLAEMMKIMADSLDSNWDSHYKNLGQDSSAQKQMLGRMRCLLKEEWKGVRVPELRDVAGREPRKLYTIDFSVMYKDNPQGAKYIPDTFPLLVKAAVNLSFHLCKPWQIDDDCKLDLGCFSTGSTQDGQESASASSLN